jgi:AraC-like DNA-binding protein
VCASLILLKESGTSPSQTFDHVTVSMRHTDGRAKGVEYLSMVASGQPAIQPLEFESSIHPDLPVEVLERSELIGRFGQSPPPDRPFFHALHLVHSGQGVHIIDFERVQLKPGRLVHIRPGQIQSWDAKCNCEATLVFSRLANVPAIVGCPKASAYRDLDPQSFAAADAIIGVLRLEQARFRGGDASTRVMYALFEALCGIFDRGSAQRAGSLPDAYAAFRESIEKNLGEAHTVRQLVDSLGYSERTVSRACQKVTGQTAREVLNTRLILEAKRLLAHTDKPVAAIAAELGFSEPTNFHKFFARHANRRPSQFREMHRRHV